MPRINPVLFVIALFVAGFAAAYSIRFAPKDRAAKAGR